MAINKVTLDGNDLIDLTQDTVTEDAVGEGITFHSASGEAKTGTLAAVQYTPQTLTSEQQAQARTNIDAADLSSLSTLQGTVEDITTGVISVPSAVKATQDANGTPITNYLLKSELLDNTYPVGSIYQSSESTSPASLFGGNWEQLEPDYTLFTIYDIEGDKSVLPGTSIGEYTLAAQSIPAGAYAIVSGYVQCSIGDDNTIIMSSVGAGNINQQTRTTCSNGGGAVSTIVADNRSNSSAMLVSLFTYNYRSTTTTFNYRLNMAVYEKNASIYKWQRIS